MRNLVGLEHTLMASCALIIMSLLIDWPYALIPATLGIGLLYIMKRKQYQANLKYLQKAIDEVFEPSKKE